MDEATEARLAKLEADAHATQVFVMALIATYPDKPALKASLARLLKIRSDQTTEKGFQAGFSASAPMHVNAALQAQIETWMRFL